MFNLKRLAGPLLPEISLSRLVALLGMIFLPFAGFSSAAAKTPGATYCFHGICHRVLTLAETEQRIGVIEILHTSFYDACGRDRYNPCGLTSSGERFHPERPDNAASPIYPDGTTLLLRNPETQDTAVVRVNNAGPYWGRRKLDVSRATAGKLGFRGRGTAKLEVQVVRAPTPAEARYRRYRTYEPVPGYIGRFADTKTAEAGLSSFLAWEKMAAVLAGEAPGGTTLKSESYMITATATAEAPEKRRIRGTPHRKITRYARARRAVHVASRSRRHTSRHYASRQQRPGKARSVARHRRNRDVRLAARSQNRRNKAAWRSMSAARRQS